MQAAPTGRNSKEKGEKDCRTVGADADGLRSRPRWRRDSTSKKTTRIAYFLNTRPLHGDGYKHGRSEARLSKAVGVEVIGHSHYISQDSHSSYPKRRHRHTPATSVRPCGALC